MIKYKYNISLSCNKLFPISPLCLVAKRYNQYKTEITECFFVDEWGECPEMDENDEYKPLPNHIYLCYEGLAEMETYDIDHLLPEIDSLWNAYKTDSGSLVFSDLLVGIAPFGKSACWIWGEKKSIVISWAESSNTTTDEDSTLAEMLEGYDEARNNLIMNGLPDRTQYDRYMQKFRYRYVVDLNDGFEFDYLDEALFDGSHDKLHDGGLMKYHDAAKPKKLTLYWHVGKSEYTAHFWFDDKWMKDIFEACYGGKADADMDFIIRLDPEEDEYGVALFRHGMDKPHEIPEEGYELIVFKNDFEAFSSENFSKADGEWLW